jgi:hypothetical protein
MAIATGKEAILMCGKDYELLQRYSRAVELRDFLVDMVTATRIIIPLFLPGTRK